MVQSEYLGFEEPIIKIENEIRELSYQSMNNPKITDQILRLRQQAEQLTRKIYQKLTPHEILQLSRHACRPHFQDYVERICTDFTELHGDRQSSDCRAIIGGLATIEGHSVMMIGHQKGRETSDKVACNFGMPTPYGYRKAKRLLSIANKFRLPVVTFIDTPGAYPGIEAEERNQSHAIAESLRYMMTLEVPIISVVIGEGGSGGALAIGVCDELHMLEYAVYSVISPEGCASILWKDAKKAGKAAKVMNITSSDLKRLGLVDHVIEEPMGGAHKNYELAAHSIKKHILDSLKKTKQCDISELLHNRHKRFMFENLEY